MKNSLLLPMTLFAVASPLAMASEMDKSAKVVAPKKVPSDIAKHKVQIALLLDTSNSMDGLIDQARSQLWKVVNTFIEAKRDGVAPYVEVALYEYGNSAVSVENDYIRLVHPMTRDLDEVSKRMFALDTNGGDEYCGAVINRALSDLDWDKNPKTYKAIFIAGNEPFTQGPADAQKACKASMGKGIVVNTIYCGERQIGIDEKWHDGAALASGRFMVINQDRMVRHIEAPQDEKIAELGKKLNKTYIRYGARRDVAAHSQLENDELAEKNKGSGANVQRAITKSSKNYSNGSWDLVDAQEQGEVDILKLKDEDLPDEYKKMPRKNLKELVDKASAERAKIQEDIAELNDQRKKYVAEQLKKRAENGEKTLDQVVIETAREQATKLGYEFKK